MQVFYLKKGPAAAVKLDLKLVDFLVTKSHLHNMPVLLRWRLEELVGSLSPPDDRAE